MKNKYFSNISINIIIVAIILIIALLTSFYGFDINKIKKATDNYLKNNENLDKKGAKLVKCIDGDTVVLKINNKNTKVRLLAIDTPEVNHPTKKKELYGEEASKYTCNKIKKAKKIQISYEKNILNVDKYNRKLVWLYIDNELLQELLIKNGYAKVRYIYAKYTYTDKLLELEKEAKNNHIRIWNNYHELNYNNITYYTLFKIDNHSLYRDVDEGKLVDIVDNPTKRGYIFVGWTKNNKLYDLSKPVTNNLILDAKFQKKS